MGMADQAVGARAVNSLVAMPASVQPQSATATCATAGNETNAASPAASLINRRMTFFFTVRCLARLEQLDRLVEGWWLRGFGDLGAYLVTLKRAEYRPGI